MVGKKYVPERGDIVRLNFNPGSGREQRGKRPAVTVSPGSYNGKVGLGLFCPITSKVKSYPFEARIQSGEIDGAALTDQVRSLDWRAREARCAAKASPEEMREIAGKIGALIF